jgi:hypothetical protein
MGEFTIRTLCSECGAVFTYEQRDARSSPNLLGGVPGRARSRPPDGRLGFAHGGAHRHLRRVRDGVPVPGASRSSASTCERPSCAAEHRRRLKRIRYARKSDVTLQLLYASCGTHARNWMHRPAAMAGGESNAGRHVGDVPARIRRMTRQFDVMLRRIRYTNQQLNLSRAEPSWRT